jgi:hypothetical protein
MPSARGSTVPDNEAKSLPQVASELWDLTKSYAKQETVDPLKNLTGFLMWGVPGAILLGAGVILLMLGLLRMLQTETDTSFTGNLSWIPYMIVIACGAVLIGLAVAMIGRKKGGL